MKQVGLLLSLLVVAASGADKIIKPAQSGNNVVDIVGTAVSDRQAVTALLGMDPGMDLVVVEIKVAPKGDNKITISRDDFTLISRKDGQRSQPLEPAQIAGKGVMVVTSTGPSAASGGMLGNRGPMWGGMPGTTGRPRRIGGDGESMSGTATPGQAEAKVITGDGQKENPLLAVLKEKILREGETNDAVSGQLYFILEGKHKLKDLDLLYKSPEGRLELDFVK